MNMNDEAGTSWGGGATDLAQKISFRFSKTGSSCFYSHHDMMRHFGRALSRAGLRPRQTDGFNPRPRMVFPHPLSLGVASLCEEIEIEFREYLPPEELYARLGREVAPVVSLRGFTVLPAVRRGRTVAASVYEISGWPEGADVAGAVERMLALPELVIRRGHERKARDMDIRPLITEASCAAGLVRVRLSHGEEGMGRADEISAYLAGVCGCDPACLLVARTEMIFA